MSQSNFKKSLESVLPDIFSDTVEDNSLKVLLQRSKENNINFRSKGKGYIVNINSKSSYLKRLGYPYGQVSLSLDRTGKSL